MCPVLTSVVPVPSSPHLTPRAPRVLRQVVGSVASMTSILRGIACREPLDLHEIGQIALEKVRAPGCADGCLFMTWGGCVWPCSFVVVVVVVFGLVWFG